MTEKELKIRTRAFAITILNFIDKLPTRRSANIIANQLGRSASSVAANYRKIGIVEEEADESVFWLDILSSTGNAKSEEVAPLLNEARQLTAIFTASCKTAKRNKPGKA